MTKADQMVAWLAFAVGVAAAVRSTWSPCGLSMLSTITPLSERARGYRYGATAVWFVGGAAVGGASLGVLCSLLAGGYRVLGAHATATAVAALLVSMAGSAADSGLWGPLLPIHRRQVNDQWLSSYRRWVYAIGFGWQIGSGLSTYIMTFAVFTMMFLSVLAGDPIVALLVCTSFGLLRGLAVLITAKASTPLRLRQLHRWMDRASEPVRWATIAVQAGAGIAAATVIGPVEAAVAGTAVMAMVAVKVRPVLIGRIHSR